MVAEKISKNELTFRPVTLDEWTDLQTLFSEAGVQNGCWCTYWRVKRSEYFRSYGEGNKKTMQRIIEAYPIIPESMPDPRYERYTGVITTFEKAGFKEVVRRSARRPIMRYIIPD
jgi:ribosomal protein L21E